MPVAEQTPYIAYTSTGAITTFAYPFRIFADTNLVVTVAGVVKDLGPDYTVTGAGSAEGGNVVFLADKKPGVNAKVEIERRLPMVRETDYQYAGGFREQTVDDDQDYQSCLIQDIEWRSSRMRADLVELQAEMTVAQADIESLQSRMSTAEQAILGIHLVPVAGIAQAVTADASIGMATVNLPLVGEVIVVKVDDTANVVRLVPQPGHTVCREASFDLTVQDETVRLILIGANWYRN